MPTTLAMGKHQRVRHGINVPINSGNLPERSVTRSDSQVNLQAPLSRRHAVTADINSRRHFVICRLEDLPQKPYTLSDSLFLRQLTSLPRQTPSRAAFYTHWRVYEFITLSKLSSWRRRSGLSRSWVWSLKFVQIGIQNVELSETGVAIGGRVQGRYSMADLTMDSKKIAPYCLPSKCSISTPTDIKANELLYALMSRIKLRVTPL